MRTKINRVPGSKLPGSACSLTSGLQNKLHGNCSKIFCLDKLDYIGNNGNIISGRLKALDGSLSVSIQLQIGKIKQVGISQL